MSRIQITTTNYDELYELEAAPAPERPRKVRLTAGEFYEKKRAKSTRANASRTRSQASRHSNPIVASV